MPGCRHLAGVATRRVRRNKSEVRGQAGNFLYVVLRRMLAAGEFPLLGIRHLD